MAVAGVHQHAGRLVQHRQVGVLIDDIQRALRRDHAWGPRRVPAKRIRWGEERALPRRGQANRQRLALPRPGADIHPHAVQGNAVLQPLHPAQHRARQPQCAAQEGVHLQSRQLGGDF